MKLKRFRTDLRIWLTVSAILFIPPWFVGTIDKHEEVRPYNLWVMLFSQPLSFPTLITGILTCSVMFGAAALAVGWVLHCLVVMIRRPRNAHGQPPGTLRGS